MDIDNWGFEMKIVDHRPLTHIWVELADGTHGDVLASPHPFCQQLIAADRAAELICDAEAYYDGLVATGGYASLDEVDDAVRAKFGALGFTTDPAPRIHD